MQDPSSSITDPRVKVWQRLLAVDAPFQVESIRILESNVFAPQLIELRRVLALVGVHGTGKTVLLRMLEAAFGYTLPLDSPPFFKGERIREYPRGSSPVSGIIEVTLRTPTRVIAHSLDLSKPASERARIWEQDLGKHSYAAWYTSPLIALSWLGLMYDHYDFSQETGPLEEEYSLTAAELRAIRQILGRRYDQVIVRKALADGMPEDPLWLPYVRATFGSKNFNTTTMSQGELWVHYALSWFLHSEVSDQNLALLDEPEEFLAVRAHRVFIDEVARRVLAKHLQLIIGTHSPDILARFPLNNIRICIPDNDGIRVVQPTSYVQIRDNLGIVTPIRSLVLVEDELAKRVLNLLFARFDVALTREVDIIPVGGEAEVLSGIRILRKMDRLGCLGVLDGDQRAERPDNQAESSILFLPGDTPPEEEMLSTAIREIAWLSRTMKVTPDDLRVAISACSYLDHQYWLKALSEKIGHSEPEIVYLLMQAWLRDSRIKREAAKLVNTVRASI